MPAESGLVSDIAPDHLSLPHDDRRRHARTALLSPASCRFADGTVRSVVVIDVSEGGFGLNCNLEVPVDTVFEITMSDAGTFPCRLAWFDDTRCGVELLASSGAFSADALAGLAATLDP
ncbi:MAG: PilZ domain-containing protein [Hyphomicrobium sp.]|nr:PilZ domain-containing protein [Hyphomicrobium sp.]